MYKKVDAELERFLCIREEKSEWLISDSPTGTAGYITSGKATNSPFLTEAGPSAKLGWDGWRYFDENAAQEGEISVSCTEE